MPQFMIVLRAAVHRGTYVVGTEAALAHREQTLQEIIMLNKSLLFAAALAFASVATVGTSMAGTTNSGSSGTVAQNQTKVAKHTKANHTKITKDVKDVKDAKAKPTAEPKVEPKAGTPTTTK